MPRGIGALAVRVALKRAARRSKFGCAASSDQPRHAFRLAFEVDLQLGKIERIEAYFDALAGQVRGSFKETILQQEGGIAALGRSGMAEVYEAVEIASSRSVAVKLLTAGLEWNESAHRARVIPRDIKPGNIIVVPQSDGGLRAVLTDFGLANPVRAARNRAHPIGWSAGHARLGEPATCRTDVY